MAAASLGIFSCSVRAQSPNPTAAPNIPTKNEARATDSRPNLSRPNVSLAAFLQLQNHQIARLDRIYDDTAAKRSRGQNDLAQLKSQLQIAQSPTAFDERRALRLSREINQTQQKISADFLMARSKSLKILEAVQRAQLESLSTDTRFGVRDDRYSQLLLLPVDKIDSLSAMNETRFQNARSSPNYGRNREEYRDRKRNNGTATYGVYGGYGYGGPQYGVRAGYGRGPVGVNIGIGRGGPSIGIGIGGIFGGRRR